MKNKIQLILTLCLGFVYGYAQTPAIEIKKDSLIYHTDEKGNRVIDFSYCGYENSEVAIPNVKSVIRVTPVVGDNASRIQQAIDYVASLPIDKNGFRGAVLLDEGNYDLNNSLRISNSGIVLRGQNKLKTILTKNGVDRGSVIYIEGKDNLKVLDTLSVTSSYVPVGATTFEVNNNHLLKVGDAIRITRPSTKEWIESIGCNIYAGGISSLGWKPGDSDKIGRASCRERVLTLA